MSCDQTIGLGNGLFFADAAFRVEGSPVAVQPVSEPATLLLLSSGVLGMGAVARRRNRPDVIAEGDTVFTKTVSSSSRQTIGQPRWTHRSTAP